MIQEVIGDIFQSDAEVIVNPVNCVGVMGKGLALQFKQRYPNMYKDYVRECRRGVMTIGHLHVVSEIRGDESILIVNFPTKRDWRDPSRYEYIERGLESLRVFINKNNIKTLALPLLGCGCGQLKESVIREMINRTLSECSCSISIYKL